MRSRASVLVGGMALLAGALLWGNDKKDKKNDARPTLGKIFFADLKTGNWTQLTSGPEDSIYLNCMDVAGRIQPGAVERGGAAGGGNPGHPPQFVLRVRAHQKKKKKKKKRTSRARPGGGRG